MLTSNYYQPWLLPFLSFRKTSLPSNIRRYYYHSFEDGLWDLLTRNKIAKGSTVLIPDFYCMDVIENIRRHGFKPVYYPVDAHFQIQIRTLRKYIQLHKPSVVIIFHAAGIPSRALQHTRWQHMLPKQIILIEDCVHRLINPSHMRLRSDTHYAIDSLRKVSPLPGSFLYSTSTSRFSPQSHSYVNRYVIHSMAYYVLFRIIYTLGTLVRSATLIRFSHTTLLKHHDDIIGNRDVSSRGIPWLIPVTSRLNFRKIQQKKEEQVKLYRRYLSHLSKPFYNIHIPVNEYKHLHVYPLGYNKPPDETLILYLHRHGVIVWYKFPDSPWSKQRGVLFLPLGFHIQARHIQHIAVHIMMWNKDHPIMDIR